QPRCAPPDREPVASDAEHLLAPRVEHPVPPADVVVLAVGVVVAALRAADLVALAEHGDALGEGEAGEQVARETVAQANHVRPLRLALDAPIVAPVGVAAVVVVLAVGLVVLALVTHQVTPG